MAIKGLNTIEDVFLNQFKKWNKTLSEVKSDGASLSSLVIIYKFYFSVNFCNKIF